MSRKDETNPRALGTNLRALGKNPRALGTNPRTLVQQKQEQEEIEAIEIADAERIEYYLAIQRAQSHDPNGLVPDFDKVCDVTYGMEVVIHWGENRLQKESFGYVLGWPKCRHQDPNLGGVVHITDQESIWRHYWFTLHELRTDPDVVRVESFEDYQSRFQRSRNEESA